jgi:hypothetical protein
MTGCQTAVADELLYFRGKLQQSLEVEDSGPIFAGARPDLFCIQVELAAEAVEGRGRFNRVEVFALDVLNEGDFEKPIVRNVSDNDRHLFNACELGSAPAAFAGN